MCRNKQIEVLEFDSVYVALQYGGVSVVMWLYLVCLLGCRGTLFGCTGCCDCDTSTVVCVACVHMLRECVGVSVTERLGWGWMGCGCGECRACGWYTWFRYCV